MNKFYIELYPKADLEREWTQTKSHPGAMPCMRCGGPMRESLAENALSRALNVYVCPACGMDEALRDAAGKVLPMREWHAVKQHRFAEHKAPQAVKLTPDCAFTDIFSGAQKTLPLSSVRHPVSLVAYSRSDYDGRQWWTTWFPDEEMRPAPELGQEIDSFQSQLLALPEFKTLRAMEWMCQLYAQPTSVRTEFNLYAETAHFHIWLRLITRERDYNLYTYFFTNN